MHSFYIRARSHIGTQYQLLLNHLVYSVKVYKLISLLMTAQEHILGKLITTPFLFIVTAGVFSQEQFSANSLFKLIFTLVSLSIIKIPSLGNIELVKLFYTV